MLNKPVTDFELLSTADSPFRLSAYLGKTVIIYFYPKDATPGCTTQGVQFRDLYPEFKAFDAEIFGISRDSLKSHHNFKQKFGFPFDLLVDTDELACNLFGVIKMKNMYGKQVRGIERSTFTLDKNGVLIKEWRGVKADGHAQEVLEFIKTLK
jgi:thioredoxin-dependent peroxiredoxin